MVRRLSLLLASCLVFVVFILSVCGAGTAYAADTVKIWDFYGEIRLLTEFHDQIDTLRSQGSQPINGVLFYVNAIFFEFFPQSGYEYEYSLDDCESPATFYPLAYGQMLKVDKDLTVRRIERFSVEFVWEGGGKADIANKGSFVSPPPPPEKEGFIFVGWKEEGSRELFNFESTPINKNYIFVPVYEQIVYTYTITFESYDGTVYYRDTFQKGYYANPPRLVREGYIFLGWKEKGADALFDFENTEIDKDYTFAPVYEQITYTLTFEYPEGTVFYRQPVPQGYFGNPPQAQREGYTFLGWKEKGSGVLFDFENTEIDKDYNFVALFREIIFTLIFEYPEGTVYKAETVPYSQAALTNPPIPVKTGYRFLGWKEKGATGYFDFEATAIDRDYTFIPEFKRVYSLRFIHPDNDEFLIECEGGLFDIGTVPMPAIPEGHDFVGWRDKESGAVFDFSAAQIEKDYTFTACFRKIMLQVKFYYYENPDPVYSFEAEYGSTICRQDLEILECEVSEGEVFSGWKEQGAPGFFDFDKPITASVSLYAVIEPLSFCVRFYDGDILLAEVDAIYGRKLPQFPDPPAKKNARFVYWSKTRPPETDRFYPIEVIKCELSLYAVFEPINYAVIADISQGIALIITPEYPDPGETVSFAYTLPEGYTLAQKKVIDGGGTVIPLEGDSFVMPESNVTLILTLEAEKYKVEVYTDGILAAYVTYGEPYTPAPPEVPMHYAFGGWYTDAQKTLPYGGTVTAAYGQAVYLYPAIERKSYNITFRYGYGSITESVVETLYGDTPAPPDASINENIVFAGWDKEISPAESDTVYTARYKFMFDKYYYDGDAIIHTERGELSENTYAPPEKEGYTFAGFTVKEINHGGFIARYTAVYVSNPPPSGGQTEEPGITPGDEIPDTPETPANENPTEPGGQPSAPAQPAADRPEIPIGRLLHGSRTPQGEVVITARKGELLFLCVYVFALLPVVRAFTRIVIKRKDLPALFRNPDK
ncbi:MAG TPA: InlB B-repeat-containing protein [Clostridia bacterium]|nr:InlB B-repeat-containing protein [Clostridia bacterium]